MGARKKTHPQKPTSDMVWLNNKPKKGQLILSLGDFTVLSGQIRITDPCYTPDTWCTACLDCVPGTWHARISVTGMRQSPAGCRQFLADLADKIYEFMPEDQPDNGILILVGAQILAVGIAHMFQTTPGSAVASRAECAQKARDYVLGVTEFDYLREAPISYLLPPGLGAVSHIQRNGIALDADSLGAAKACVLSALDKTAKGEARVDRVKCLHAYSTLITPAFAGDASATGWHQATDIGVDSGQAGVFDAEFFRIVKSSLAEEFYDAACDLTQSPRSGGVLGEGMVEANQHRGVVAHSGYGDGMYTVLFRGRPANEVLIIFISDDEEPSDDYEPWEETQEPPNS